MTEHPVLVALPEPIEPPAAPPTRPAEARTVRPVPTQLEWAPRELDAALSPDHPARAIWAFLERLDLASFSAGSKAVADRPGRPASDPRVLLAVWLYATTQGVGSARHLARLCDEHDAYRWIRGDVPVDYHLLAELRVTHEQELDDLLTTILAAMLTEGLVPGAYLLDGGFVKRDDITTLEQRGVTVYAPLRPPRTTTSGRTATDPRPDDSTEVIAWRERMGTEEAKAIYKERAATAECVNALCRLRGVQPFRVRGLAKALSCMLLVAITHNLLRWIALSP